MSLFNDFDLSQLLKHDFSQYAELATIATESLFPVNSPESYARVLAIRQMITMIRAKPDMIFGLNLDTAMVVLGDTLPGLLSFDREQFNELSKIEKLEAIHSAMNKPGEPFKQYTDNVLNSLEYVVEGLDLALYQYQVNSADEVHQAAVMALKASWNENDSSILSSEESAAIDRLHHCAQMNEAQIQQASDGLSKLLKRQNEYLESFSERRKEYMVNLSANRKVELQFAASDEVDEITSRYDELMSVEKVDDKIMRDIAEAYFKDSDAGLWPTAAVAEQILTETKLPSQLRDCINAYSQNVKEIRAGLRPKTVAAQDLQDAMRSQMKAAQAAAREKHLSTTNQAGLVSDSHAATKKR